MANGYRKTIFTQAGYDAWLRGGIINSIKHENYKDTIFKGKLIHTGTYNWFMNELSDRILTYKMIRAFIVSLPISKLTRLYKNLRLLAIRKDPINATSFGNFDTLEDLPLEYAKEHAYQLYDILKEEAIKLRESYSVTNGFVHSKPVTLLEVFVIIQHWCFYRENFAKAVFTDPLMVSLYEDSHVEFNEVRQLSMRMFISDKFLNYTEFRDFLYRVLIGKLVLKTEMWEGYGKIRIPM